MTLRIAAGLGRLRPTLEVPRAVFLLGISFALVGVAQAQNTTVQENQAAVGMPPAASSGLSWHGITLYGVVDLGFQYETRGAPFSDYLAASSADIVQKNSRRAISGLASSNLSQSRVGLQGTERLNLGDWASVFRLETFFNPTSGQISDALKSLTQNNGRTLDQQNTNLDSSVGGQAFQQAYAGLSSPTFGTITFGRQNSVLADGIAQYDPNAASQAFSLIGISGVAAGGGNTQDRRLDSSLKYGMQCRTFRLGAMYKFSNANTGANSAYELSLGGHYGGFSADAYYVKVKSAIALSPLSAAQVTELPALSYSVSNSLAATVSDNTTFGLLAMYSVAPLKLYAGYENIKFVNPQTPLAAGFEVAAYRIAFVNNMAFPHERVLQVYWAGAKYSVNSNLDLTMAYYGYHQSNFATTAATVGCSSDVSGACSGELRAVSFDAVYKLSKRFDVFAGSMYSGVAGGLANGYVYSKNNIATTTGVRFSF